MITMDSLCAFLVRVANFEGVPRVADIPEFVRRYNPPGFESVFLWMKAKGSRASAQSSKRAYLSSG